MAKVLHCGEVVAGCTAVIRGETEEDVLRQGRAHAEKDHGIVEHPPEKVAEVKGKIRDE